MANEITSVSFSRGVSAVDQDLSSTAINNPGRQADQDNRAQAVREETASEAVRESQRQQQQEQKRESAKDIAGFVDEINENARLRSRNLELSVNEELNRTIVKVVDAESGELIRQIPTENVIKLARLLNGEEGQLDRAVGLLIDSQV